MTLLGHMDGEDAFGASYLELMEFISRHGASVENDLEELWRRIVFSICVKNTDDHLRNHGFYFRKKDGCFPRHMILTPMNTEKG